jgi:signal transduction histidine kinase
MTREEWERKNKLLEEAKQEIRELLKELRSGSIDEERMEAILKEIEKCMEELEPWGWP